MIVSLDPLISKVSIACNMFRIFVILFFVGLASSQTTQVAQCINHRGDLPLNTYIERCITPPCVLPQMQDAVINIVFKAPRVIRSMRTLATAYVRMGLITIPVPYDLGQNSVTCNFLTNTFCPILPGEIVQYTLRMYIEPFFPLDEQVNIEFRVVDEANQPLLCIRLTIRIGAPIQTENNVNSILKIDDMNV